MTLTTREQRSAIVNPPWATRRRALSALVLLCALPAVAFPGSLPIKLNGPLPPGGDVSFTPSFGPDGSTVLYRADQDTDEVFELYSVPVDGGMPVKLNGPMVTGGDVRDARFTPDGQTVVYLADQLTNDKFELFSVAATGGPFTRLNRDLPTGGNVSDFSISPDGMTVVYFGDQDTDNLSEIYSVPIGGGTITKLNPPLPGGGRQVLFTRFISGDSSTVVYLADQETNNVNELYSVPIGGGTVIKLNDPLPDGGDVGLFGIKLSPDGSTMVYSADQETNNLHEIFSVPVGGGPVVKLNGPMPADGAIFEFQFTPDGSTVVYRGTQNVIGIDELFSVPVGSGAITPLSNPGDTTFNYQISPDGSTVVYQTSTGGAGQDQLFSVPVLGGTVTQLNAPLPAGQTVESFEISADSSSVVYSIGFIDVIEGGSPGTALFSVPIAGGTPIQLTPEFVGGSGLSGFDISRDSRYLVYQSNQDAPGVDEIHLVSLSGGASVKLNAPLVSGGDVQAFVQNADGSRLMYMADQDTDEVREIFSLAPELPELPPEIFSDGFE
ncbi:MAG: PD40 domain-containing protein [Xanthomonadales bacterium]|nr:PD40 domain-containing protein [Xanthomonadales bacterium]